MSKITLNVHNVRRVLFIKASKPTDRWATLSIVGDTDEEVIEITLFHSEMEQLPIEVEPA